MGQKSLYTLNSTIRTLKETIADTLSYKAELSLVKLFRTGKLPIGLVEAYDQQTGGNILRLCKINHFLWYVSSISLTSFYALLNYIVIIVMIPNRIALAKTWPGQIIILTILISTGCAIWRHFYFKKKVAAFANSCRQFVEGFPELFQEDEPLDPTTDAAKLAELVDESMMLITRDIMSKEGQTATVSLEDPSVSYPYSRRQTRSDAACKFGFGKKWGEYWRVALQDYPGDYVI